MKIRLLIIVLAICMIATPAIAGPYRMDTATAATMNQIGSVSTNDLGGVEYIGYKDGQSLADYISGTWSLYDADSMIYNVGFSGDLKEQSGDGLAQLTIGLSSPSLIGWYNTFELPIANDNDDIWEYRSFVTVGGGSPTYSSWTQLTSDTMTTLIVNLGVNNINFATVTAIGFDIQWDTTLNQGRKGDIFSTSVVPVPAAVLLGILGLGVVGWKLRKYA